MKWVIYPTIVVTRALPFEVITRHYDTSRPVALTANKPFGRMVQPSLLARGNIALAAVLIDVNTALSLLPLIVPALFILLTGIELHVPVGTAVLNQSCRCWCPPSSAFFCELAMPVSPREIGVPAAFFAVVQMITSPVAAKVLASRGRHLASRAARTDSA